MRVRAASWLGDHQVADPQVIAKLRGLADRDHEGDVRAVAILALGAAKDLPAWDIIAAKQTDKDAKVRLNVAEVLGALDPAKAAPVLEKLLADSEESVRLVAARGLAASPAGLAVLHAALAKGGDVAQLALTAFGKSTDPAAQLAVAEAIAKSTGALRLAAIRAAGDGRLVQAIPALAALVVAPLTKGGGDAQHSQAAAESLIAIGTPEALSALVPLVGSGGRERQVVIETLKKNRDAVRPALLVRLADPATGSQVQAILDLLRGDRSDATREGLLGLLRQGANGLPDAAKQLADDPVRRMAAATALRGRIDSAKDSDQRLLAALAEALGYVGAQGDGPDGAAVFALFAKAEAITAAKNAAEAADELRMAAATASGRLRYPPAAPVMREMMAGNRPDLVVAAIAGLAAMGDTESVDAAIAALETPKGNIWVTRSGGLRALSRFKDPRCVAFYGRLLATPLAQDIRDHCLFGTAATGLAEGAELLVSKLADPAMPVEVKRDKLYFAIVAMGATPRPQLLRLALTAGEPVSGHDAGWWAAELLRTLLVDDPGTAVLLREAIAGHDPASAGKKPAGRPLARLLYALSATAEPDSLQVLTAHLSDGDPTIRRHVAGLLVENRRTAALPALETALASETDPKVKASFSRAVEGLSAKR
ncbi:hypothetical protein LBMAG53_11910 [Planctomycetota bacterium]|nr:hypothetical protein LBMAG53_11910 [Planctomycetota bacterium]